MADGSMFSLELVMETEKPGKQPRPAAEEGPMQCAPITEPSTSYSEDWDGMVTRSAAHTAQLTEEEREALMELIRLHDTLNLADGRYYDDERVVLTYARRWMPALAHAIDVLRRLAEQGSGAKEGGT